MNAGLWSDEQGSATGLGAIPLVGRDSEIAVVEEFLFGDARGASTLVLEGPAGIGKTSLWRSGVERAQERGLTVLVSRPSPEDSRLGFAGLADLFEDVDLAALDGVAPPKRTALEGALALRERGEDNIGFPVSSGALAVIRELSAARLVLAIDDADWLDPETSSTLAFALRRAGRSDVRLLVTQRTPVEGPSPLLRSAPEPDRLIVRPLSFGAIGRLLHDQLGVSLSRGAARRVYEASAGNPLLALEVARSIVSADSEPSREPVDALLAERVGRLRPASRSALLAVALAGPLTPRELAVVAGQVAFDQALEDRVLTIEGSHVRAAHPLLAAVARAGSRRGEQQELHRRLGFALEDELRRALHVGKATPGPNPEVAAKVGAAAALAARRGASSTAAELGEAALRLTPRTDPAYAERLLDAADYLWRAGELGRCAELVRPAVQWLPAGLPRARALRLLSVSDAVGDAAAHMACLQRALAETPPRSWLRVEIQTTLAGHTALGMVKDVPAAEALAGEAFAMATDPDDRRRRTYAAAVLIWTRNLRVRPLEELAEYPLGVHDAPLYYSVDRAMAVGRMWRGEIGEARSTFESLLQLADDRGEGEAYFALRVQLCELELRAGRLDVVAGLLDDWAREAPEPVGHQAGLLRFRAMLAAERGDPTAVVVADEAVACAERVGMRWHALEARRARGLAALVSGNVAAACPGFGEVDEYLRREGVENPGAFPLAADYVEALVRAARIGEGRAVLERLSSHAEHPWAEAAAARSRGHVLSGEGAGEEAIGAFADAATRCERLELRFDLARSLLAKGSAERRLRRKREARASLEEAADVFRTLGAPGWATLAEAEAARIGGRRRSEGGLTPTEARVAELVRQGLTNKQIAAALVVTVGSVEAHLTRIYAKLQVRSRTDLVRVLSDDGRDA